MVGDALVSIVCLLFKVIFVFTTNFVGMQHCVFSVFYEHASVHLEFPVFHVSPLLFPRPCVE